jgi:hypothetical protein
MKGAGGGSGCGLGGLRKSNSAFCFRPLLHLLTRCSHIPVLKKIDLRFFGCHFTKTKSKIRSQGKALN